MYWQVMEARYVSGYTIWMRFRDGLTGEVDFEHDLHGQVFEPLRDVELFRQFEVHPECQTLVWSNGADMAPEYLHENARAAAELQMIL